MEKRYYFFSLLAIFSLTAFANDSEELCLKREDFLRPVVFRPAGIQSFFLRRFNNRFYAENFLPFCFLHVEDFFDYSLTSKEPRVLALVTLDLFHQKLKEARFVNPFALSLLLQSLPAKLGPLCADELDNQKATVKKLILEKLETDFDSFKQDPEEFVSSLASTLVEEIVNPSAPAAREISDMAVRFIESALDKVIWDPKDQEYTWESVKLIAQQLETLHAHTIIAYEKDLNHLLWSLVSRFCYFIEIAGSNIAASTYYLIKNDLEDCAQKAPFLLREELETYSLTKRERLMEVILAAEVALKLNTLP